MATTSFIWGSHASLNFQTHLRIETTDLNATLRNAADSLSDSSVPNIVVGETNRLLSDKNHVFCREDDPSNRACGAFECAPIGFVIHCNVPLDLESFVDAAMAGRSTLNCRPAKARSSTLAVVVARLLWMDQVSFSSFMVATCFEVLEHDDETEQTTPQIVTLNFRIEPDPILFARVKEDSEGYRGILVDQWQLYPAARYAAVLLALWVTGVTWGSNIFGSMCRKAVEPLVVDMYQAEGITAAPNSVSLLNLLKRALVALQSPMSLRLPHCDFQMITSDASFSNDLGYLAYCATQSLEALTRPLV
ncbi:hypothetical protein BDR26DRAFT_942053 [Obelidium mucronatum]|nr:hypothetical protein BDR26DRAFT_942053 [Obelidium mucronatum]